MSAYTQDLGNANIAINQDSQTNPYVGKLKDLGDEASQISTVGPQDFSDVEETEGGLSALAQAFHQMSLQGSPVLKAQQNIQNAQLARQEAAQQTYAGKAEAGAQAGAQGANAAGQDSQQNQNQSQGMNNQILAAKLQQTAIQMQLTHAAAQENIAKQKLQSTANLSADATLTAQQSLIQNAQNSVTQIQQGEGQLNFNDWMKGIGIATNIGSQAFAIGSKMGSNTGASNSLNNGNPANTDDQSAGSFGNNEPNANYTGPDQGGSMPDDTGSYGN